MSIYDKASLVLIPSGTKTSKVYSQVPTNGDGDFTFSRSTAATRVNASGNIEKETQNLFTYSNTFSDSSWYKVNTSVTGGQSGYDGTNDAWLLSKSAASAQVYKDVGSNVSTYSIYAKAGTLGGIRLVISTTSTYDSADFDLTNGVLGAVGSVIDASIEDVGGGWYRCSIVGGQVPITRLRMYPATSAGSIADASGNIYIQDAQLEQGLVARDYIETTTTAIYGGITDNVPRLDYTDSSCPALLLEPQRTNNIAHSEYIDSWTKSGFTGEANTSDTTSPEGLYNAYKTTATNADPYFLVIPSATFATGDVTFSMWVKGSGSAIGKGGGIYMDITFGTATGTNVFESYTITDEWVRWEVTGTLTSGGTIRFRLEAPNGADVGDVVYVYGAQAEQGSYATSYIPTYGSAVTRNAEVCTRGSASSIIGQNEGVIFAEVDFKGAASTDTHRFTISDSGSNNWIFVSIEGGTNLRYYIRIGANTYIDGNVGSKFVAGNTYKIALRYKSGDTAVFINGLEIGSGNTTIFPNPTTPLSRCNISGNANNSNPVQYTQSGLKQTLLFPTALSNEELATLTTI